MKRTSKNMSIMQTSNEIEEDGLRFQKVSELRSGQMFGELALISNKPRAATIKCITDTHFAVLDRRTFQIIQKSQEDFVEQRVEILRNVPFFSQVSKIALMKYQHYFKEHYFVRGQYVIKEGQELSHYHIIIDGEFELSKRVQFLPSNWK